MTFCYYRYYLCLLENTLIMWKLAGKSLFTKPESAAVWEFYFFSTVCKMIRSTQHSKSNTNKFISVQLFLCLYLCFCLCVCMYCMYMYIYTRNTCSLITYVSSNIPFCSVNAFCKHVNS